MLSLINSSVFDEKEAHRAHWVFSWEITTHAFSLTHSSFFASRRFSFFFFLVLVSRFNWEIIITTTADRSHRWLRPTTRRAIDDAVIIASTSYFNKLYQRYTTKNIYILFYSNYFRLFHRSIDPLLVLHPPTLLFDLVIYWNFNDYSHLSFLGDY